MKPAEHGGALMQVLPKTLKSRHLVEKVWSLGNVTAMVIWS
jgi:hypothetical protein